MMINKCLVGLFHKLCVMPTLTFFSFLIFFPATDYRLDWSIEWAFDEHQSFNSESLSGIMSPNPFQLNCVHNGRPGVSAADVAEHLGNFEFGSAGRDALDLATGRQRFGGLNQATSFGNAIRSNAFILCLLFIMVIVISHMRMDFVKLFKMSWCFVNHRCFKNK